MKVRATKAGDPCGGSEPITVSMKSRYQREGLKTGLGLLGEGQLSLTKWVVVLDHETDARDIHAVLRAIHKNFDPSRDLLILPGTSMDTLDFTSFKMNLGSKMILDATGDLGPAPPIETPIPAEIPTTRGVIAHRVLDQCLLAVKIDEANRRRGREIVEELVTRPELAGLKMIVAVSEDVDIRDDVDLLWGFLTRFEPARDVVFADSRLEGVRPVYRGPMGFDATFKDGYPDPLVMPEPIVERVDRRWHEYFPRGLE